MLIRMLKNANDNEFIAVQMLVKEFGEDSKRFGHTFVVLGENTVLAEKLITMKGVFSLENFDSPFKFSARTVNPEGTRIKVGDREIGGEEFIVIAGPCAVESWAQIQRAAKGVSMAGARILRGGVYKPRTSPYSFQGLEAKGLPLLAKAGLTAGLPTITEVVSVEDIPVVARYTDILQVGARNAQNYSLLKALGKAGKPVLLKRGFAETVEEFLYCAEHIINSGNPEVILCERGIRTFETSTRNTLDLNSVAVLKKMTHLPVVVDPSHGTGRRDLIMPLSKAAAAAGADGLIIEVHPEPEKALSDGHQSLNLEQFGELMGELFVFMPVVSRRLALPSESLRQSLLFKIKELDLQLDTYRKQLIVDYEAKVS